MIESVNNERVKYYTKLNEKKYRLSEGLFIACGKHLVEEALARGIVKEIFMLQGEENPYNIDVTYASESVMKKISDLSNSPKELAICFIENDNTIKGNVVILDNIKDPGNMGTIIRSAVAFGYDTIVLSDECVDLYNPKVVRASEGMLFNINFIIGNIFDTINNLKHMDYLIYGTDVNGGVAPFNEKSKHAIIIGSEAKGMNPLLKEYCNKCIYVPMNKKCESLNAGVCASIIMYELGGK